ncbi:hypothetical protein P7K49_016988, partial [Saguinus oedipus]
FAYREAVELRRMKSHWIFSQTTLTDSLMENNDFPQHWSTVDPLCDVGLPTGKANHVLI